MIVENSKRRRLSFRSTLDFTFLWESKRSVKRKKKKGKKNSKEFIDTSYTRWYLAAVHLNSVTVRRRNCDSCAFVGIACLWLRFPFFLLLLLSILSSNLFLSLPLTFYSINFLSFLFFFLFFPVFFPLEETWNGKNLFIVRYNAAMCLYKRV